MPAKQATAVGHRPRLLVLRALGLGDLLTAVPALRALAEAFPGHRRELAAPAVLTSLVALVPGRWDLAPAEPLAPLRPGLTGAAVGVNLHGSGPESHRVLLDARPGELFAFEHPDVPETRGMPPWRAGEHEVARWCRLLEGFGLTADARRLEIEAPTPGAIAVPQDATVIHPGAASASRRWPAERFAAVAAAERCAGRPVLVTGAPGEAAVAGEVAAAAGLPEEAVLAGRTDLGRLAAVVAGAARLVCGDTGIAHLATALGTPSVVLFGPTSPAEWGPPADRPRHRVLWEGATGDPHGGEPDPGLLRIEAGTVVEALARL